MNTAQTSAHRATDNGYMLWPMFARTWVRCPQCGGPALVTAGKDGVRLSCGHCGHARAHIPELHFGTTGEDPRRSRCRRCGRDFPRRIGVRGQRHGRDLWAKRRCAGCGLVADYGLHHRWFDIKEARDPWFGLPLYLTTEVRGRTLWVANAAQLALLEDYLGAALRERSPTHAYHWSMMSRLPRWMKVAGSRTAVRVGLARLRAAALKAGIA